MQEGKIMGGEIAVDNELIGNIVNISVDLIQPYKGQPRTYFDPIALQALADSILAEGQKTPAWVMPVCNEKDPDIKYELIAGERRWRACKLAGIKTLRAEIRQLESEGDQYLDSVMENYGRRDCTSIETARAIQKVSIIQFGENPPWGEHVAQKLANFFVRSVPWINQHRNLLKLHHEVQAMMEGSVPEKFRLKFAHATALSNLPQDVQLSLAQKIVHEGVSYKKGLSLIRSETNDSMRIRRQGPGRRPSDDFDILKRFLKNLGQGSEGLLDMPFKTFERMFCNRSPEELHSMIAVINRRIGQLKNISDILERVSERGKPDGKIHLALKQS